MTLPVCRYLSLPVVALILLHILVLCLFGEEKSGARCKKIFSLLLPCFLYHFISTSSQIYNSTNQCNQSPVIGAGSLMAFIHFIIAFFAGKTVIELSTPWNQRS